MISFIITLIILVFVAVSIFKFTKPTKKKEPVEEVSYKIPTPPIKIINKRWIRFYVNDYYIIDSFGEIYKARIDTSVMKATEMDEYTFIGCNITPEQYVKEMQN